MRKCFREQKKRAKQQEQSHKARLPETITPQEIDQITLETVKEIIAEHSRPISKPSGRRM